MCQNSFDRAILKANQMLKYAPYLEGDLFLNEVKNTIDSLYRYSENNPINMIEVIRIEKEIKRMETEFISQKFENESYYE